MGNTVSRATRSQTHHASQPRQHSATLYAHSQRAGAERKYLNKEERRRVIAAMSQLDGPAALFALTLAWSGARISEVLALTPASLQIEQSLISIVTLKRRRWCVREVPIPPELMRALAKEFLLGAVQKNGDRIDARLWPISRSTAWRIVKRIMTAAGISGRAACPRGLRHAFGVGTLQAGIPITLVQKWLGHARLSTTAIYAQAVGPDELAFASRFWNTANDAHRAASAGSGQGAS